MSNEVKTALIVAAAILATIYINNNYLHLQKTISL